MDGGNEVECGLRQEVSWWPLKEERQMDVGGWAGVERRRADRNARLLVTEVVGGL